MAAAVIIALVVATALSGAVFGPGDWYDSLKKPSWNPPDWVFPVVWTTLYAMIAWSGWIVWDEVGFGLAIVVWGLQLVLNAAWSALFFGMKRMDLAFVDCCALWLAVAAYIVLAWPISTFAALLFVPYLAWVTTAACLNRAVWRLNPEEAAA